MTAKMMVPVNEPLLNGNEKKYLNECIETAWISSEGPFITRFEEAISGYCARKYGIAVANGTAALDIAVAALDIKAGDEVILPDFTIISCAAAIVKAGATPVVVDCDGDTWNMDAALIESKVTPRTKAIMIVHIYGLCADIDAILNLAKKYNLKVIEDAAEAMGLMYKGKPCGSFGHISTLSFYPNKMVTSGEGGMLLCNDPGLAERCQSLRNLCFSVKRRFVHEELGWNYRLSNIQAALGLAQFEMIEEHLQLKAAMGEAYWDAFNQFDHIKLQTKSLPYAKNIFWVFGLVFLRKTTEELEKLVRMLAQNGVGTRPFFWPIHEQPVFSERGYFDNAQCPKASKIARQGIYLPGGMGMRPEQLEYVISTVRELLINDL